MTSEQTPSELASLVGELLVSSYDPEVRYELEAVIGEGATAAAFRARRFGPGGSTLVVVKVLLPRLVRHQDELVRLAFRKEVVALQRLGEQVPPTPFVVRLLEAGDLVTTRFGPELVLPWLAVELVDGGEEGTALSDRIQRCRAESGCAFPAERVARAVQCLVEGLEAIHRVGVVHRDLNPYNVLCCGSGPQELFKIADFGISQPVGMNATFGNVQIGTPGYAAPEQIFRGGSSTSPASDVFSLGALVFTMLTGEELFLATDAGRFLLEVRGPTRRELCQARALDPELRARPELCQQIDALIARATSFAPEQRFQRAAELGATLLPLLRRPRWAVLYHAPAPSTRRWPDLSRALPSCWSWQVQQAAGDECVIRSLAWQTGGQALALSSRGLECWDGTDWRLAPASELDLSRACFVRAIEPGRWLLGGQEGLLVCLLHDRPSLRLAVPSKDATFVDGDGDPNDLAVLVAEDQEKIALHALCGGRWLKPLVLGSDLVVAALCRVSDDSWLVVGRRLEGHGAAWLYQPLQWELRPLSVPATRAYLACSALSSRSTAVAAGIGGAAFVLEAGQAARPLPAVEADLSAVALAADGSAWAASRGSLWRLGSGASYWQRVWQDSSLAVPIIGLYAEEGRVLAISVDGAVVEGRVINP